MKSKEVETKMLSWYDDHWYKVVYLKGKKQVTEYFASVTTVLNAISKPFLATWRGDIGNREADLRVWESQQKGTRVHNAWYTFNTGGIVIYNPWDAQIHTEEDIRALKEKYDGNYSILRYQDEMHNVYKLQKWVEVVQPQFLYSEHILYSLKHKSAGTADNIMFIPEGTYMINGAKPLYLPEGIYIVDLKTGKGVYDEAYMQVAAYREFFEEMGLGEIMGALIIHTAGRAKKGIPGLATHLRTCEQMDEDFKIFRHTQYIWNKKNATAAPRLFNFPSVIASDVPMIELEDAEQPKEKKKAPVKKKVTKKETK